MSVDHLQINVIDAIYNNQTWLYQVLSGSHNDAIEALADLSGAMDAVVGLTKQGTRLSSNDTSGTDNMQFEVQDPVYGGSSYLSSTDASNLRDAIITQLAAISGYLESYKDVAIRSYRNDLQKSDLYTYQVSESQGLEIFISNFTYNGVLYVEPADIDTLLLDVNNTLDNISGLEFSGIVASTYKASTNGIFIGVDDAWYNDVKYLSLSNATTLRNDIFNAIATVSGIDDSNLQVEVRIAKKDNQPST
jgi:hypothetical protein